MISLNETDRFFFFVRYLRSFMRMERRTLPAPLPQNWPPLALHRASLAKLEHLSGGDLAGALRVAERAVAALEVCQGDGPPLRQVLRVRVSESGPVLQHLHTQLVAMFYTNIRVRDFS
jgi:hypothetical protein